MALAAAETALASTARVDACCAPPKREASTPLSTTAMFVMGRAVGVGKAEKTDEVAKEVVADAVGGAKKAVKVEDAVDEAVAVGDALVETVKEAVEEAVARLDKLASAVREAVDELVLLAEAEAVAVDVAVTVAALNEVGKQESPAP